MHAVRTPRGGARLTPREDCSQAEKGQILRGPTPGVRSGFAQNKVAPNARRGQQAGGTGRLRSRRAGPRAERPGGPTPGVRRGQQAGGGEQRAAKRHGGAASEGAASGRHRAAKVTAGRPEGREARKQSYIKAENKSKADEDKRTRAQRQNTRGEEHKQEEQAGGAGSWRRHV